MLFVKGFTRKSSSVRNSISKKCNYRSDTFNGKRQSSGVVVSVVYGGNTGVIYEVLQLSQKIPVCALVVSDKTRNFYVSVMKGTRLRLKKVK